MQQQELATRIETLRDEFRDLLMELKRRKAAIGSTVLSDDVSYTDTHDTLKR